MGSDLLTSVCKDSFRFRYPQGSLSDRLVIEDSEVFFAKRSTYLDLFWNRGEIEKENQKSWVNFLKAVKLQSFTTQKKIFDFFKRHSIDVEERLSQGLPLEKRHLDLALVALATPHVTDFQFSAEKPTFSEVAKKIQTMVLSVLDLLAEAPLAGGIWAYYDLLFIDRISREKERIFSTQTLFSLQSTEGYFELLSKEIVARELTEGMILPGPQGEDFYYVYKKVQEKGFFAYALKPLLHSSSLKPALFFRPTQLSLSAENALDTFADNLDPRGVGAETFDAVCEKLDLLMKDPDFRNGKKIWIGGFSLGGTYAQLFLAHKDNFESVEKAFFFNDPGVNTKVAELFADKINRQNVERRDLPSLSLFRTKGDYFDLGGESHIGFGIKHPNVEMILTEISPENSSATLLERHNSCFLEKSDPKRVIDLTKKENRFLLENCKRGKPILWVESFRRLVGFFFLPFILFFLWLKKIFI